MHVALAFNPSHLEVVDPVVEGSVRARQERRGDARGERVVPLLVHGDAAFAGQGVVMETLQLSQARGFYTGGTIHVVINNQVGFTTADPRDARSTIYCSDVAKMLEAPIFHVNADDPEAVVFVARLALQYRVRFHKDVVIDLVCYRRHGHNEADEPAATQPLMYHAIRQHPTARALYAQRLIKEGALTEADASAMVEQYRQGLDEGRPQARASLGMIGNKYTVDWSEYSQVDWTERVQSALQMRRLRSLGQRIVSIPVGFTLHPRVAQVMANRTRMIAGELPLDWGCAETLAYAALLEDGFAVRLTGQDSARGTFFHRHAVLHDQQSDRTYIPPAARGRAPAALRGHRFGAVGRGRHGLRVRLFDDGAQLARDLGRPVWRLRERRTGDHRSVHQLRRGQMGPHVRARAVPAARLRGAGAGAFLGAPRAFPAAVRRGEHAGVCALDAGADVSCAAAADAAALQKAPYLDDAEEPAATRTVGLRAAGFHARRIRDRDRRDRRCSGRTRAPNRLLRRQGLFRPVEGAAQRGIARCRAGAHRAALSFPGEEYAAVLRRYPNAREIVWCQEEPQNQGAWYQIRHRLQEFAGARREVLYAGRASAAAPATGLIKVHESEQQGIVQAARYTRVQPMIRRWRPRPRLPLPP